MISSRDVIIIDDDGEEEEGCLRCPLCMSTIGGEDLQAHFARDHAELECPFCAGVSFASERTLREHLDAAHPDNHEESTRFVFEGLRGL